VLTRNLPARGGVLFTKAYARVLAPGLCVLDPRLPEDVVAQPFELGLERL
jgi:hypothetical protein